MKIVIANNFKDKLIGLMGKKNINYSLLIKNCKSIHTFFMKENIDVIMCDKYDNVIYYYNNLKKNKIIFPKRKVYKIIELPVNYFDIKINTKIRID